MAAAVGAQAVGDAPLTVFDPPVEVEVRPGVWHEDWETYRVFEAEIRKRETLAELPGDDFYREWMRLAIHPAHVEQVSSYFDRAWREAMRRHHQASVQPRPDGAPASPAASFSRSGQAV